ncbi:MAG: hypothetical protein WC356_02575 [Candidatus Micrarchaeia archaeon]|jgi:hypothetical protein
MLQRIERGIYAKGLTRELIPKKDICIAVHPFFLRKDIGPVEKTLIFEEKLKKELNKLNSTLIVFEEEYEVNDNYNIITQFFNTTENSLIIIPTYEANPTPNRTNWCGAINFIKSIWNEKNSIKLLGGYIWKDKYSIYRGCLGYTEIKLNEFGIPTQLIKELTFS